MASKESAVYIAGVGLSLSNSSTSIDDIVLSAGTKALLDAGITYDDVNQSIACFLDRNLNVERKSFDTFGRTGTPVYKVDNYSGIHVAAQLVKSGSVDVVMVAGFDEDRSSKRWWRNGQVAAISSIIVSPLFLQSHAYLKDSATRIMASQVASPTHSRASKSDDETLSTKKAIQAALREAQLLPEDIQILELRHGSHSGAQAALGEMKVSEDSTASPISHPFVGRTGWAGICELVWQLRGWSHTRAIPHARNALQYTLGPDGTAYVAVLCRSDSKPAPEWEEVKYLRDGRERLGHNPAIESRDISMEDWQAVKARDNFVPESIVKRLRLTARGGDRAALARL